MGAHPQNIAFPIVVYLGCAKCSCPVAYACVWELRRLNGINL